MKFCNDNEDHCQAYFRIDKGNTKYCSANYIPPDDKLPIISEEKENGDRHLVARYGEDWRSK